MQKSRKTRTVYGHDHEGVPGGEIYTNAIDSIINRWKHLPGEFEKRQQQKVGDISTGPIWNTEMVHNESRHMAIVAKDRPSDEQLARLALRFYKNLLSMRHNCDNANVAVKESSAYADELVMSIDFTIEIVSKEQN